MINHAKISIFFEIESIAFNNFLYSVLYRCEISNGPNLFHGICPKLFFDRHLLM